MSKEYDSDSDIEVQEEEQVEEEEQVDNTLNNSDVVTKYQEAAKIAQAVLVEVAKKVILFFISLFYCFFFLNMKIFFLIKIFLQLFIISLFNFCIFFLSAFQVLLS